MEGPPIYTTKDDYHQNIGVGYISSALFALAGTFSLLLGKAYLPQPGFQLIHFRMVILERPDWRYWSAVAAEFGLALALFGWYGLANTTRFARLARPTTALGVVGIIIGIVAIFANLVVG